MPADRLGKVITKNIYVGEGMRELWGYIIKHTFHKQGGKSQSEKWFVSALHESSC